MNLKKGLSFLRWRLVFLRHLTGLRYLGVSKRKLPSLYQAGKVEDNGYYVAGQIDDDVIDRINTYYAERYKTAHTYDTGKHTFVNLFKSEDISIDNPLVQLAFSPQIFDQACNYFQEKVTMFSIQLLYSFKRGQQLKESQYWHKDFGDNNSFHAIIYAKDVLEEKDGPFVFVDKHDTKKIKKSVFIRRIPDDVFKKELGDGKIVEFYGKKGSYVLVDPSVCYHYGSRCENPRIAIFITFNTDSPFDKPDKSITEYKEKLFDVATKLRPDISSDFLSNVLMR